MPRPVTKKELTEAANANYEKLFAFIETMTEKELDTPFDFSSLNKKEAHWARDKNLRDVLAHLYEWHRLLLEWTEANLNGNERPFIPKPYTWKTYGDMNIEFWNKHQSTDLKAVTEMLKNSHNDVMALLDRFSDEELSLTMVSNELAVSPNYLSALIKKTKKKSPKKIKAENRRRNVY